MVEFLEDITRHYRMMKRYFIMTGDCSSMIFNTSRLRNVTQVSDSLLTDKRKEIGFLNALGEVLSAKARRSWLPDPRQHQRHPSLDFNVLNPR